MAGYLTYVIVYFSAALLLSGISALSAARSLDLSHAIAIERGYGLLMNAKECALEAARLGAADGFDAYDASHESDLCRHCTDHFCAPPTVANPLPPNICEETLCQKCFREPQARAAADAGAFSALGRLKGNPPVEDFNVSFGIILPDGFESNLLPDAASKNGFRIGSVMFGEDLRIKVQSGKLGVSLEGRVPEGTVVRYGQSPD